MNRQDDGDVKSSAYAFKMTLPFTVEAPSTAKSKTKRADEI